MLTLRLQRTGRKKIANYRVIAQEHSVQPTSGKVAAYLGHYNPHTKEAELDKDKIKFYLDNGAQPSDSAAKLFKAQGIKLPDWVSIHQYEDKKVIREAEEKAKAAEEAKQAKAAEAEAKKAEAEAKKAEDEAAADKPDQKPAEADGDDDAKEAADKADDKAEDSEDKSADDAKASNDK